MLKVISIVAGSMLATAAMGADFENHLTSTPIVSPAQLYQVEQLRTDFAVGYGSQESTTKADGADELANTVTGTNLFAAGIYNVSNIGLRAGLTVDYTAGKAENEEFNATGGVDKYKGDATFTTLTPVVAYTAGPVVLGAALDVVTETVKVDEADEAKATYNIFRPGALYAAKGIEAGLTYTAPYRKTAEDLDELSVEEAAVVTAHGRLAVNNDLTVGAIISNVNYAAINEDALEDQQQVTGTVEYGLGAVKIDGDIGYHTAYNKNDDSLSAETVGTFALGAGADYSINKDAKVGGALGYEFGSDDNDVAEYAVNDLTLAVRGDLKF